MYVVVNTSTQHMDKEGAVTGKELYSQYSGNHPTIHCNRFPAWSELTQAMRDRWDRKAAASPGCMGCADAICDECEPPDAEIWQDTPPTESGWYWHHDGDAMHPVYVFPRPGHSYMAVQDEPNAMTGKRDFRMVERMGGSWMPISIPTPPLRVPVNTPK